MRRAWAGASLLFLAGHGLAGCGGGDEQTTSTSGTTGEQTTGGAAGTGATGGTAGAAGTGATGGAAGAAGTGATGGAGGATGGTGGATGGTAGSGGSAADILDQIKVVPGVLTVEEQPSTLGGYRYFAIDFDQPVDHDDPGGQHFTQRLVLQHKDTSAPFVLASSGYYLFIDPDYQYLEEPTELLGANQLFVEHRYFYPSRPDPADWTLLNIKQAAADHHSIVQALRPIYSGKWISTGGSKGGMTSMYHHRFYPNDVDGTVAYVAPHSAGRDDPRYIDFLNNVGTPECRQKLVDFEREVLMRRNAMEQRMADQAAQNGVGYDLLGLDASFESTVITFSFVFWQYGDASLCDAIPGMGATDDDVFAFFDEVGLTLFSTDPYVLGFEPYYWQAYTQLGTPGIDNTPIADLLQVDFTKVDDLPSINLDPMFDPAAMQDISSWLKSGGSHILFIYGQNDPWSAAAFDLAGTTDSYKLFVPGGNHGSLISELAPADKQVALDALKAWTGVAPLQMSKPSRARPMEPPLQLFFRRALK